MQVIGWADRSASPPSGVSMHRVGTVAVLAANDDDRTSYDRLQMVQNCFDHGIDVLPALSHPGLSIERAKHIAKACDHTINRQLERLSGKGQFSVLVKDGNPPSSSTEWETGRSWLQQRRIDVLQRADRVVYFKGILKRLLDDLPCHDGLAQTGTDRIQYDILVSRSDVHQFCKGIRDLDIPEIAGTTLMVSGLWAPLSFSDLQLEPAEHG